MGELGRTFSGIPPGRPENEHEDRRQQVRYPLRDARGHLSWDEAGRRVTIEVCVTNISEGGAAALADCAPPADRTLALTLASGQADTTPWRARVIGSSVDSSGQLLLRIRFPSAVELGAVLERYQERRLYPRYLAQERAARLLWYVQDAERAVPCELWNISGGGAAVITANAPPANEPLWLELETGASAIQPAEARLVVVTDDLSGTKIARLRLVEACPIELFERAVHGSR
jgi:PilZ domain